MGKASRNKRERIKVPAGAPRAASAGRPAWLLPALGGALLVAIAVGAILLLSGNSVDVAKAMADANCTLRDVKPLPPSKGKDASYHADAPTVETKVKWSTDPPSAGGHYGNWAVWGFYREAVPPTMLVHNLEHSGVVIWMGPGVSGAEIDKLNGFYNDDPNSMIATRYAPLGNKIALTAWTGDPEDYAAKKDDGMGHIAVCPRYDEAAFKAFRSAYRGKGPEGFPTSANPPGTGPGTS
jgi:hypothetical protein